MTFSLINIGLGKAMQEITDMAMLSSPSSPPSEEARKRVIQEMTAAAEERLVDCNHSIPQQRLTLVCTRFLIRKTDFLTRVHWILLHERAGLDADFTSEENLIEALDILEDRMHLKDEMLGQFSWTMKAYPQYHILMCVLLYLCRRPEGPAVDRAWRAVDTFFEEEVQNGITADSGSKLYLLAALKTKAQSMRKQVQSKPSESRARNNANEHDSASQRGSSTHTGSAPTLMDDVTRLELGVDANMGGWPKNWADIAHEFQLDNPGVSW